MNAFADAIVADLQAFSAELVDVGLARPAPAHQSMRAPANFRSTLHLVEALTGLVPRLVDELELTEFTSREEFHATLSPKRAMLSVRPSDYAVAGATLLPRTWIEMVPVVGADVRPLAWLLHLLVVLAERLADARGRMARHVAEALVARRGGSEYALRDEEALRAIEARLENAGARLARSRAALVAAARGRIHESEVLPRPYPRSPSWSALRAIADLLLRPHRHLPALLRDLLSAPCTVADLPFLYQRWVGLKILKALEMLGFHSLDDAVGPLFLGGRIRLLREQLPLTLWYDPRISRADHPSGLQASSAEVTPDFVLVTAGPGGEDAFVLDATLAHDVAVRDHKSSYRERIEFRALRFVAGVPARRVPLRAWAVAPLLAIHNQLGSPDGAYGTIPLHPERFSDVALRAWLADVVAHARAWHA